LRQVRDAPTQDFENQFKHQGRAPRAGVRGSCKMGRLTFAFVAKPHETYASRG
jgi:hypothetical protein